MSYLQSIDKKIECIKSNSKITEGNKQILERFTNACLGESMSPRRVVKYLNYLSQQAEILGLDFDKAQKEDLQRLVAEIEKKSWAEWTKYDNKVMLKKFYKWLEGDGEEMPKKIRWLQARIKNHKLISPHDLLTDEEVSKMIAVCTNIRDKAFVSVLYESGCRISELLSMKVKDVVEDDYGLVIHVTGKTGPRRIRLIDSVPYLSNWTANHPKDRESPLWVSIGTLNNGKQLSYNSIRSNLIELAKKAGISKPINPHAWRKANSTKLASVMTEFELKERQGWTQSSKVAGIYVRLSGKNVDDAYFRAKGICVECKKARSVSNNLCEDCKGKPNGKTNVLEPKICPRCTHKCEPTGRICSQCGFPLSEKIAIELFERRKKADSIMDVAVKYPEMMKLLEEIIRKESL